MGSLATLADLTPTTSAEVETRHRALDPRIRHKLAKLDDEREARHAVVQALRLKLDALRSELVAKRRRLADAIAIAAPEWSHGESAPGGGAGAVVVTGGFRDRAVREQEVARLAENLQHAETAYQAASVRWASIARLVENCRGWIEATPIAAIVPVVVTYERIADPRCEVEAIRAKIITLGEEAAQVEGGPVSLADALARLDEQRRKVAERVAARRADGVRGFFSPRGISDVARLGLAEGYGSVGRELEAAIQEAADARFLADVGEWRSAIKAAPITGKPVPLAERAPRLAQLARDRAELERQEERVVMCAERDGVQLDRRADASPRGRLHRHRRGRRRIGWRSGRPVPL